MAQCHLKLHETMADGKALVARFLSGVDSVER